MKTTARKLQALGVLAMMLGACTQQVPTASHVAGVAPDQAATVAFQSQAAEAVTVESDDTEAQRRGRGGDGNRRRGDNGRRKAPTPGTPKQPRDRYRTPDDRYVRHPGYRNPDYRYYPPNDRYVDTVKVTRIWTEDVGPNEVTVKWTTNVPTHGVVAWRQDGQTQYSPWQYPSDVYHSYTITDLEPGTTYWYRVTVRTDGGATAMSPEMTVQTEPQAEN